MVRYSLMRTNHLTTLFLSRPNIWLLGFGQRPTGRHRLDGLLKKARAEMTPTVEAKIPLASHNGDDTATMEVMLTAVGRVFEVRSSVTD